MYRTNPAVPKISDNCNESGKVKCDFHYQPDYGMRIDSEFKCDQTLAINPCFGTFACVCDNSYFSIANQMPEVIPEEYEGIAKTDAAIAKVIADELVAQKEREKLEASDKDGDDDEILLGLSEEDLMIYGGATLGAIIVIIIVICCLCKCKKKNQSISPVIELASGSSAEKKRERNASRNDKVKGKGSK